MKKPSYEELERAVLDANDALFDSHFNCYKEQVEHQVRCHPEQLPAILRMLAKSQREAMKSLQGVVQRMVRG